MFRIPDKEGRDVDFLLNEEQLAFVNNMSGRDLIAKARQLGFSTLVLGLFLARCLMERNRRCVIASQKLLERIKYMIKHMKGAQPALKYNTQNFITFEKMDSSIYIGTAGSEDFGVGDTITDLHCSEVSRWKNPGPLLSGLFQTVPTTGNIIIESTGRGVGNWFHRAAMRAQEGQGYKLHFFSWLNRPEYRLDRGEEIVPDAALEEDDLLARFGVLPAQLLWRRLKIAELDGDLQQFREQYPCCLEECFQATGNSFFSKVNYAPTKDWVRENHSTERLVGHPKLGHFYVAGADPAGGVGLDAAALEVFDIETGEQVLEYTNNKIEADVFARKCAAILEEFDSPLLNFERNNHGILFASEIVKCYDKKRLSISTHHRGKGHQLENRTELRKLADYGTYTTEVSKNLMLGRMKSYLRDGTLIIHSAKLQGECQSFVESASGTLGAEDGCHDDTVMATALAISMFEKAATLAGLARRKVRDSKKYTRGEIFKVENLLKELEEKYRGGEDGLPISTGVEESENSYY